jgi:predicted AAA+ superfamily ATPase
MGADKEYRGRVLDAELRDRLDDVGAVLIEGPKACGKTMTAQRRAARTYWLEADSIARATADLAPERLLDGPQPVLLDEWQTVPSLWDSVRESVTAHSSAAGMHILTGSSTPEEPDEVIGHVVGGQIAVIQMRTLSLWESGHSTGEVSLADLLDGSVVSANDPGLTVPDLIDRICTGGWPGLLDARGGDARRWLRDYLDDAVHVDLTELGPRRRDPQTVRRLLAALALHVGTPATHAELAFDMSVGSVPVARPAVARILDVLSRLKLVEDSPAWIPRLREHRPQETQPRRYFVDPSLAVAALGQGPAHLRSDLASTAALFENLVVRDLRVYSQTIGGRVHHWADRAGASVDAVITLPDGRWAAFDVLLNPADVDRAAASLVAFAADVHPRIGPPAALGVITSTGFGFQRQDGVSVIPVGTLGP